MRNCKECGKLNPQTNDSFKNIRRTYCSMACAKKGRRKSLNMSHYNFIH